MNEQQRETMAEVLGCLAEARSGVIRARNLAAPDPLTRTAVDAALSAVAVAFRIVDEAVDRDTFAFEFGRADRLHTVR